MRLEGRFKMILQDDNVRVSHSIHLVDLLQALLAVLNTLLHVCVCVCVQVQERSVADLLTQAAETAHAISETCSMYMHVCTCTCM